MDKLVKVWLKSGEERWLLIHVEVLAVKESDFTKRMYVYNYRIFDRYDREVISLAILADDDAGWRPCSYGYRRWGFRVGVKFPVAKLLDYVPRAPALEADPNPFATVVLAHLKTLETRRSPLDRQAWKIRLVEGLYERGLSADDVRQLFRFIDWIMELPLELQEHFEEEIHRYEEEKQMPFITGIERRAHEKGLLEGIEVLLRVKFGNEGQALLPEIRDLHDHEVLLAILQAIETTNTPEDLRQVWTQKRAKRKRRT